MLAHKESSQFDTFLAMTKSTESGFDYDSTPTSTPSDLLLDQMDDLTENITQLQALIKPKRKNKAEAVPRLGESLAAAAESRNPTFSWLTCFKIGCKWALNAFLEFIRVVMYMELALTCVSVIVAMYWDQDLIDPYLEKYFGNTVFERLVKSLRDDWQIPLQHGLNCVCPHFPLYRSKRRRFWDVVYTFFFSYHKMCRREKTVWGAVSNIVECLRSSAQGRWKSNGC